MSTFRVNSSDADVLKNVAADIFQDIRYDTLVSGMMGGQDAPIYEIMELGKGKGANVHYRLFETHEDDAGVSGDQQLETREEKLTRYTDSLTLQMYRHAIEYEMDMSEIYVNLDIPAVAKSQLSEWGKKKVERLCMDELQNSPSLQIFGGDATAVATDLATADAMSLSLISKLRTIATTGNNGNQSPIQPFRYNGRDMFMLILHPFQVYDLKTSENASAIDWIEAHKDASVRGEMNPLFTGAVGVWDGVIIKESRMVNFETTGGPGGDVPYATGIFLGKQALTWAWGIRPRIDIIRKDFNRLEAIGYTMVAGVKKTEFNSKDYGVMSLVTACTNLTLS